jgi:hypothetical protein
MLFRDMAHVIANRHKADDQVVGEPCNRYQGIVLKRSVGSADVRQRCDKCHGRDQWGDHRTPGRLFIPLTDFGPHSYPGSTAARVARPYLCGSMPRLT